MYAQQNQFLSEYELRTEKKEGAKAVRRQMPVFFKPYRPNKITAEGGVWAKKVVTLRRLRISEKKEILRKLTVHTFVLIYLLYQIFLGRILGRNSLQTDGHQTSDTRHQTTV